MISKFMTKREAAEYLKVDEKTIDNWVKSGALIPCRSEASTLIRFLVSDIENFFAKNPETSLSDKEKQG
jgi:excisionase family DNA binding protein